MGLCAVYAKPNTSKSHPEHIVYPYLLKGVDVNRPNQVWCADITYIRLTQGFAYLVAILAWNSWYVLSWRLSNSLDADFCIEVLEESLNRYVHLISFVFVLTFLFFILFSIISIFLILFNIHYLN